MSKTTVILEDHPLLAGITSEVIKSLLPDIEVHIANTLAVLEQDRPHADFLIIDLHLEDADGQDVLERIRTIYPNTPGLVYTSETDASAMASFYSFEFLDKRCSSSDFFKTLAGLFVKHRLGTGEHLEGETLNVGRYIFQSKVIAPGDNKPLTVKQVEIMECCSDGLTAKETAAKLGIGMETVRAHMTQIFERLGAKNAPQAVRIYLEAKRIAEMKSGAYGTWQDAEDSSES